MRLKSYKIYLLFLIIFSIYCSLVVGKSWDEGAHLKIGKSTLDYLFSLGIINDYTFYREHFAPIYWSLKYFITLIFPFKYQIEVTHIINLIFSLCAIFGIGRISKELFNQKVGQLTFLILFFFPVFFGHMSFNGKDMFLAFCHVWIFYLIIRYLKNQDNKNKSKNYVFFLGIIAASATGLELVFLGSLLPIFIFVLAEVYFLQKFICKNFSKKKLYIDIIKSFIIFYFFLILFWVDTHSNILNKPASLFFEHLSLMSGELQRGWPFNLLNGQYYLSWQVPKLHFLINFAFKSPEYFLLSYVIFIFLLIKLNFFFQKRFKFFNYKLIIILSIMIMPVLVSFITKVLVYDGLRHYLWAVPYFCIIPSLTIYCLIETFNLINSKIALTALSILIIYFLYNFFALTPYQYAYLNIFNGKTEKKFKKFENDYWGVSATELIKESNFDKNQNIKLAICGVHPRIYDYLKENGYKNIERSKPENADHIIMTNRTSLASGKLTTENDWKNVKILNCFDRFEGEDIFQLKRNRLILSVIRKKNDKSSWN